MAVAEKGSSGEGGTRTGWLAEVIGTTLPTELRNAAAVYVFKRRYKNLMKTTSIKTLYRLSKYLAKSNKQLLAINNIHFAAGKLVVDLINNERLPTNEKRQCSGLRNADTIRVQMVKFIKKILQKRLGQDIADIMNYCEGPGKSEFSEDFQYIIDNIPNLTRLIQEITKVNIKKIAVPIWKQIKNKNDYWAAQDSCAIYST